MADSQMSDILILALISGIVAVLTSMMGISGTVIGAVVSSIVAELLKRYIKNPVTERLSQADDSTTTPSSTHVFDTPRQQQNRSVRNNNIKNQYTQPQNTQTTATASDSYTSHISTRALFLFPLVVILLVELIHFFAVINLLPYDLFYSLESITNWTLFRIIGFSLVVMGLYPLITDTIETKHGFILIIVGIIELIIGFADSFAFASMLYGLFDSLRDLMTIAIILSILYTIVTVPSELKQKQQTEDHYNPQNRYEPQAQNRYEPQDVETGLDQHATQFNQNNNNQHDNRRYNQQNRQNNYKQQQNNQNKFTDPKYEEDPYNKPKKRRSNKFTKNSRNNSNKQEKNYNNQEKNINKNEEKISDDDIELLDIETEFDDDHDDDYFYY